MKTIFLATLVSMTGCASFSTTQIDERIDNETGEKTRIETRVKATAFCASKSALANFKASQTEKNQGANVGSLVQESDASKIVESAVSAAVHAAIGK